MSSTNWTATGCGLSVLPTGYILSKHSESNNRINWTVRARNADSHVSNFYFFY